MRSHPEQTTSPPLMVRASRAPARAAEGRAGAIPIQSTPAGSTDAGTSLSGRAARADGAGGLPGVPALRVRGSLSQIRELEQKRVAPRRPDTSEQGPSPDRGRPGLPSRRPPSSQAPRPAASSAAIGIRGTLPRPGAGASVPCAPPPRDRTSPECFPKDTMLHAHTHTHTHNAPRSVHSSLPALGFGEPGTILPFALVGGWRVTVPHAREAGRKGKTARVRWAVGAGQVLSRPPSAGQRRAAGARDPAGFAGGWVHARGRRRGRGAGRNQALVFSALGMDPTVPSPCAPSAPPPPPGASGRF